MNKNKKNMKIIKMGRPEKSFDEKDWKILDNAIIWGSEIYCADTLKVSVSTLENRIRERHNCTFNEYKDKKKEPLRLNLFNKQYQVAMQGNVSMLIWLGKNELKQSDKTESNVIITDTAKIREEFRNIIAM